MMVDELKMDEMIMFTYVEIPFRQDFLQNLPYKVIPSGFGYRKYSIL